MMESLIRILGYFTFSKILLRILTFAYKRLFKRPLDLKRISKNGDAWVLVTGATDGIGKAYAFELAGRGFNVVLVSRNATRLQRCKEELERANLEVQVRCVQVDFAKDDVAAYEEVVEQSTRDINVVVLVNNVAAEQRIARFHELSKEDADSVLRCNILSSHALSRLFIPKMAEAGCGIVINVSGISYRWTIPCVSVHFGTKAYLTKWSNTLTVECSGSGIIVQTVNPGPVDTKKLLCTENLIPAFLINTPRALANNSLRSLGVESNITGCWVHDLLLETADLFNVLAAIVYHNRVILSKYFLKKKN